MATILDAKATLRSINVRKQVTAAVEKNLKGMVLMNLGQLYAGEDTNGNPFAPYKWKWYADMKEEMNPNPGRGNPDLKLTGNFYRGFFAVITGSDIVMDSTDPKAAELLAKYGGENGELLFGLNEDNTALFAEIAAKDLQRSIEAHTGLKFNP